jgi:hypothetical protein
MGYSYNAFAGEIMDCIQKLPKFEVGTDNELFLERGRENNDGAMTGTVYQCFLLNGERRCKKIGSYRISKNGIERFAGLTKQEKQSCEEVGKARDEMRHSNFKMWFETAI